MGIKKQSSSVLTVRRQSTWGLPEAHSAELSLGFRVLGCRVEGFWFAAQCLGVRVWAFRVLPALYKGFVRLLRAAASCP